MKYEKPTLQIIDLDIVETLGNDDIITGSSDPVTPWVPEPSSFDV